MRVDLAAVVGAAVATLLAVVSDAAHPAQVVVTIAAGCAFLAVLTRGRAASPSDWFTVQILLAGNLIVFGITNARRLGHGLAVPVVLFGVLLLSAAVWIYLRGRGGAGRGR